MKAFPIYSQQIGEGYLTSMTCYAKSSQQDGIQQTVREHTQAVKKLAQTYGKAFGAEIPFSFRAHTTIGVGGDAEAALYPATAEGFSFAVSRLRSAGIAFLVLGKGSNVLASDAGYRGVVLRTDRMRSLTLTEQGILAQCGVGVGSLLRFAAENGEHPRRGESILTR